MFRGMVLAMLPAAEADTLKAFGQMLYSYTTECADTNFNWAPQLRGLADDLETTAALFDRYLEEHDLPALKKAHPVVGWSGRLLELAAEVRAAVSDGEE
jgi:hypothetical protein